MPAGASIGLLPPFLPTAFPLNLCVSKACEALCLYHPCCLFTTLCGHISPLARLEQGTCREWKGAEALMQLRSCSTMVKTVGLNALLLNSKACVFSLWLIFLACFLLGNVQRQVHGSGQQYWLGFLIRLCSDYSNPWKGPVTPLVCQGITSPDREVG